MIGFRYILPFAALAGLFASPASAEPLIVTKTSQTVSDPLGNLLPKAIPGAQVDYTIRATNPVGNVLTSVKGLDFSDAIPPRTKLRVADLGLLSSGPVAIDIGSSLLGYVFTTLNSTTDGLFFSSNNGATWTYQPVMDADGCDAAITNVRVKLTGNLLAGTSASIRFRVKVK